MSWRAWHPTIWPAMLGVATMSLMSTPWLGILMVGGCVGIAAQITREPRLARRSDR